MKIKELLRADTLPAVDVRKSAVEKTREIEFDLIDFIGRQIRRLPALKNPLPSPNAPSHNAPPQNANARSRSEREAAGCGSS